MAVRKVSSQLYAQLDVITRKRFDAALVRSRQAAGLEKAPVEVQRVFIAMLRHFGFQVPIQELTRWLRKQLPHR